MPDAKRKREKRKIPIKIAEFRSRGIIYYQWHDREGRYQLLDSRPSKRFLRSIGAYIVVEKGRVVKDA